MTRTPLLLLPQDANERQISNTAVSADIDFIILFLFAVVEIFIVFRTFGDFKIKLDPAVNIIYAECAAVIGHNALDYGETEAEAVGASVMRLVCPVKTIPYFGDILLRDMLARVYDRNADAAVAPFFGAYRDSLFACAV